MSEMGTIDEKVADMYDLFMQGYSYPQIGERYGIEGSTVWNHLKRCNYDCTFDIFDLSDESVGSLHDQHIQMIQARHKGQVLAIPPRYLTENAQFPVDEKAFRFFYAVESDTPLVYRFIWYGRLLNKPRKQAIRLFHSSYYAAMYYKRKKWNVNMSRLCEALFSEKLLSIDEIKRWFVNYWTVANED